MRRGAIKQLMIQKEFKLDFFLKTLTLRKIFKKNFDFQNETILKAKPMWF